MLDIQEVMKRLAEPFSIKIVDFRPMAGTVAAFIDGRDVAGRLDEVLTPANWSFEVSDPIIRNRQETSAQRIDIAIVKGKLTLDLNGKIVVREDFGEGTPARKDNDENIIKGAASDALKRCAVQMGVFRYAYNLKGWVQQSVVDSKKLELPYWALPQIDKKCEECSAEMPEVVHGSDGKDYDGGYVISRMYYKFGRILCPSCARSNK